MSLRGWISEQTSAALERWRGSPWGAAVAEADAALEKLQHTLSRVRRLDPSFLGLRFEALRLHTADGVSLAAWWVPGRSGRPGGGASVVLHPHFGGQRATTLPWLELLHDMGFDALSFDPRGHGESDAPRRHWVEFTARAHDVHAAIAEVKRRREQPVIAIGQSQGAAAVALAAASNAEIAAVVADSGPAPELWTASWGLAGAALGPRRHAYSRAALALFFTARGGPLRYSLNLWPALRKLRERPLLWLHGTEDDVIPLERSELWYRALHPKAPHWSSLRVEGARHVALVQKEPALVRAALLRLRSSIHGAGPEGR